MWFWGDSFDCYALPADALLGYWDSGTTSFTLGTGRFSGSRGIANSGFSAVNAYLVKSSGQNDAVHHISVAFMTSQTTSAVGGLWITLSDAGTAQCTIVFQNGTGGNGSIELRSGAAGGTVLATYASAFTPNTWYQFEFEVVINNTTGSFKVRRNGNTSDDHSTTGLNTRGGTANNYANRIAIGHQSNYTGHNQDDFLWRSDTATVPWVGDIRCYTRRPAANVSVQWTPNGAANNWDCVDEAQQDALTTYVSSANVNDTDQYTLTGTASVPTTVVGVTTRGLFQKSDAGTRNAVVQLKSGGTTVESASTALNTTWGWIARTDLTDPATGAAWTPGGVSTAQVGARVAA